MNRADLKNEIFTFRAQVDNYRRAILRPDTYGNDYSHRETMMNIYRSQLNQVYGKLEKYIDKIGGGIGQTYLCAFGDGSTREITSAISSAIQNLDRIIGRLDGMSDKEFGDLFVVKSHGQIASVLDDQSQTNNNPHRQYWGMIVKQTGDWIKKHISEIIIGVVIAVIAAGIIFFIGWNK